MRHRVGCGFVAQYLSSRRQGLHQRGGCGRRCRTSRWTSWPGRGCRWLRSRPPRSEQGREIQSERRVEPPAITRSVYLSTCDDRFQLPTTLRSVRLVGGRSERRYLPEKNLI